MSKPRNFQEMQYNFFKGIKKKKLLSSTIFNLVEKRPSLDHSLS